MKDRFSIGSEQYAAFRPLHPQAFFEYLKTIIPNPETAWDCGTGNGQVAVALADFFEHIEATDISKQQLQQATQKDNIHYSIQAAEQTTFQDNTFDLIIAAQAIHWFDFEEFYNEVNRTGKNGALIIALGYGLFESIPEIDRIIRTFYQTEIGPYWDAERRYVDENYKTIPFGFEEIQAPTFAMQYRWNYEHLMGYLNTWSAVKNYEKTNGINPVTLIKDELKTLMQDRTYDIHFPVLLRIGRISK